jgi:hypothetical protein
MQVSVEGIRLHVVASGDGPPLLLINGIGAQAGMWKPLREAPPAPRRIALPAIHDLVCDRERRDAVEATKRMLDADPRATHEPHPLALLSAGVRSFWT